MLHLHELAKQSSQESHITLESRLPAHVISPCVLKVTCQVRAFENYYLLELETQGHLRLVCQRCLQAFDSVYINASQIAVCQTDERANQLQDQYECIVSPHYQVQLSELITDELHLYSPQFHPETKDCGSDILRILSENGES